jgi:hypothetical protein
MMKHPLCSEGSYVIKAYLDIVKLVLESLKKRKLEKKKGWIDDVTWISLINQ